MKKCPFCECPVSEANILCPSCKKIITEPERTRKQRLKNIIFGALILIGVIGLSIAVFLMLGDTPATAFLKGNVELCTGIGNTDTVLMDRLKNEAFKANWQITFKNVRYLPSGDTGDLRLDCTMQKTKYDAAFASFYDYNGLQFDRQVILLKGKNAYAGQPGSGKTPYYMELFSTEGLPFSDRLTMLFTQFKTKDEFSRVWLSIFSLLAETIEGRYVHAGTGELVSALTGSKEQVKTVTLSLGREGLLSTFDNLKKKLAETPAAYDNMQKLFGYLTGDKNVKIRDIVENVITSRLNSQPADSRLDWTVYFKNAKAVALDISYANTNVSYRFFLQNETNDSRSMLRMRCDKPASGGSEALHIDLDLGVSNEGNYTSGKKYGIAMKLDYQNGKNGLKADMATEAVLRQISAGEYRTSGDATLQLDKDGAQKAFNVRYDFSYVFKELNVIGDSPDFPVSALTSEAVKAAPEVFLGNLAESYFKVFLLDKVEAVK